LTERSGGTVATTLKAAAPTTDNPPDTTLPDPSPLARTLLFVGLVLAAGLAVVMNAAGWTANAFSPQKGDVNFSIFAGFYAGAQIIERLMELVAPVLPVDLRGVTGDAAKVAQAKADRAKGALAVAAVLGVAAANAFGLFFLQTIGIHVSHTIDSFATGLVIASGTKPLHDFITMLQSKSSPATSTTAT
jgi:hypothetical protein